MFEESSVNILNWHKVKLGKSLEVVIVNIIERYTKVW